MGVVKRSARRRFDEEGWTLLRGLVPKPVCSEVRQAFLDEVKPYPGPLLRQLTSRWELHDLSDEGWMRNPLQNPHQTAFERFRRSEQTVMGHSALVLVASELMGTPVAMLQSAYYESSRGTKTHVDFNPIAAERPMVGAWVALEPIDASAGRFFVYPGSHRLERVGALQTYLDLAADNYRSNFVDFDGQADETTARAVLEEVIDAAALERVVPALATGDVLFWRNSLLHGSQVPTPGGDTRHSLLFHFIERRLVQPEGGVRA